MIRGRTVTLRRLTLEDVPHLRAWWQDAELMRFYDLLPIKNSQEIREEVCGLLKNPTRLDFLVHDIQGHPIGQAYLKNIDWKNRHCDIVVMIAHPEYRRRFCGAETSFLLLRHAFHELNMHKVYARILDHAKDSLALARILPFEEEAVLRKTATQNDTRRSIYIFALTKVRFDDLFDTIWKRSYSVCQSDKTSL